MKTVIIFEDKKSKEKVCQIFEYETEEQKKWLEENFIDKEYIIYRQDIDALSYLQHRRDHNI